MGKLIIVFLLSFSASAVPGKYYIQWLKRRGIGQRIKERGPVWHMYKQGTPSLGGVIFILPVLLMFPIFGIECMINGSFEYLFILLFALAFGALGFLDDLEKLKNHQNKGLSIKKKGLLQIAIALAFLLPLVLSGCISTDLYIPFFCVTLYIPKWLYIIISVYIVFATVNGANFTDGADGLATGATLPMLLFFLVLFFLKNTPFSGALYTAALIGGLCGFLIYNFYPAKCFMGDTGSMFLGASVVGLVYVIDMPLILLTLALTYSIESTSVLIQIIHFKRTHGGRFFRMAPFHHHLELGGWSGRHKWTEKQLFALFMGISVVMAAVSVIGV